MVLIPRIIAGLMSMDGLAAWATKPTRDNENMTKEYVWLMKKFEMLPRTFLNTKLHLPYDHWLESTVVCRVKEARVLSRHCMYGVFTGYLLLFTLVYVVLIFDILFFELFKLRESLRATKPFGNTLFNDSQRPLVVDNLTEPVYNTIVP